MSLLTTRELTAGYGDLKAISGINLSIAQGELLALVGANGAGKTTFLKTIAGALASMSGSIDYKQQDITSLPDFKRTQLGIALVPEGRRLFPSLTVEENLLVGSAPKRKGPWNLTTVYELLPLLANLKNRNSARLSGGEQQAVAIGRGLMSNPDLLLLDEVSLGLAPIVVDQIYGALPEIRKQGLGIILVEQDLKRTLEVADRIACLLEGHLILEGKPAELTHQQITDAYFGHSISSFSEDFEQSEDK
ncbi:high-affinity branched-chain amino acid transport ATP-binding protein LivF [mine drainage metagenome]|uniref:High-affinity branched-chain amino acid transport ATP-binding protein LivF n=1 Tax=mine drainage metagenome TaxID=410659 RepID=A0A1J5PQZ1_9ZZZZ